MYDCAAWNPFLLNLLHCYRQTSAASWFRNSSHILYMTISAIYGGSKFLNTHCVTKFWAQVSRNLCGFNFKWKALFLPSTFQNHPSFDIFKINSIDRKIFEHRKEIIDRKEMFLSFLQTAIAHWRQSTSKTWPNQHRQEWPDQTRQRNKFIINNRQILNNQSLLSVLFKAIIIQLKIGKVR